MQIWGGSIRKWTWALSGLLIVGFTTGLAHADIIAGQGGTATGTSSFNPQGVSWTQTAAYTNVSVTAELASMNAQGGGTGTVYLTNMIGPGTTAANEIAVATLSGVPGTATEVLVFSGLNLGPGTYYAVLFNTPGTVGVLGEGNQTLDSLATPGNTTNLDLTYGSGDNSYPPADVFFSVSSDIFDGIYTVSGTPAAAVSPEPSSLILLGTGLLGFAGITRRRLA